MGEFITPPSLPPTTYCRRLLIPNSPEWIGTVTGALMDLIYPSAWKQTTGISAEEAADRAREMFNLYLNSGNDGECGDMACCGELAIIYRVNPETGFVEQSSNNGTTWTPAAGGFSSVIVEPIPPVLNGVAVNKCDAAQNLSDQVEVWIDQVSSDFDTAGSLLAFAEGVLIAIVAALTLILSAGALTPIQALVLPTLGAALTAAWAAGKAAFDAYWTTTNKEIVRCNAYCNIGDNGAFTDAQFSAFWNDCNVELPSAPAKMLFMGFLSSVGRQGVNLMAATGGTVGGDCSACGDCSDCVMVGSVTFGTLVENVGCRWRIASAPISGVHAVNFRIDTDGANSYPDACGYFNVTLVSGATLTSASYDLCGSIGNSVPTGNGLRNFAALVSSGGEFVVDVEVQNSPWP